MIWHIFKVYLATGVVTIVIDAIWLMFVVNKYYQPKLEKISRQSTGKPFGPTWKSTFLVYIIMILGLMIFVFPKIIDGSFWHAFQLGAFYGLVVYGIYDLVSFSALKGTSINLAVLDIAWGVVLYGTASMLALWFNNYFI